MKEINCEVIQDLLPSYSDKISSKSTNELVDGHLQKCENCREILSKMNKDIDINVLNSNDTKIDYLKGYKKRKKKTVIVSIVLTIIILLGIFLLNVYKENIILNKYFGYADLDKVKVEYMYEDYDEMSGYKYLVIYLYSEEYQGMQLFSTQYCQGDAIRNYEVVSRKLSKNSEYEWDGYEGHLYLDDGLEEIYLVDKQGKKKEIWNKNMKVQTKEEWKKWYIDSYVPKEIKDLYNMSYDNIPVTTETWKYIYNEKYNK